MKKFALFQAAALLSLGWFVAAAPRRVAAPLPSPAATAAGLTPDKGTFRMLQQGKELGTEQFEISRAANGWIFRGDASIHAQGGDAHSSGQLRLTADGTPIHYDWTVQASKKASGSVDFMGSTAKTTITIEGKDLHQDFTFASPKVAVLDNNLYDQWAVFAQIYDWNAKGTQTIPVFIPQDATPGSATVESTGPQQVEGASLEGLRFRTTDLEVNLYFDGQHRLMRLEVPAAKVTIVRR